MYLVRLRYPSGEVVYWHVGGGWVSNPALAEVFYDRTRALRKARYERGADREGFERWLRSEAKRDRVHKQAWSPRTYERPELPAFRDVDVVEVM